MLRWLRATEMVDPPEEQMLVVETDAGSLASSLALVSARAASESGAGTKASPVGASASAAVPETRVAADGLLQLERFCRHSRYHPRKLPVGYAPPLPRTPMWLLPAKALRTMRRKGAAGLAEETTRYWRWVRHGVQRRLAAPRTASKAAEPTGKGKNE